MNIYQALCAAWADKANGHLPIKGGAVDRFFKHIQNHVGEDESAAGSIEELKFLGGLMHSAADKIEKYREPNHG